MSNFTIIPGDSYDILDQFADNTFDSIVTDPPYGLGDEPDALSVLTDWVNHGFHVVKAKGGFMGKEWDAFVPQPALWRKVFRVLKPGGHLVSFFGTRTYDWGVLALRLAGFEVRDQLAWVYSSGMPKGLDVSRAIDMHLGADRSEKKVQTSGDLFNAPGEVVAGKVWTVGGGSSLNMRTGEAREVFAAQRDPETDAAKKWDGWHTGLKPAFEPIVLCRKPPIGSTAENVLQFGTGALNIDACRITSNERFYGKNGSDFARQSENEVLGKDHKSKAAKPSNLDTPAGRYPANLLHDGTQPVLDCFGGPDKNPARFFYCGKASKEDRNAGLQNHMVEKVVGHNYRDKCGNCGGYIFQNPGRKSACKCETPERVPNTMAGNHHPTVKPTDVMRWLCRLVTPPGGLILDPFFGSGSTGRGAVLEGFKVFGIELDAEMCEIARLRVVDAERAKKAADDLKKIQPELF